ncbi:MAG: hypothetical protein WB780_20635 [Candidatus Acidiferrales bacterium]
MAKRFRYQEQDCPLTLAEGLAEYYKGHPGLFRPAELSEESARFFRSHDTAHVVFGLDTTLDQEALADAWTMFGTDVGMRRYARYLQTNQEAKQLLKEIGWVKIIVLSLRFLPKFVSVWLRTRKMRKKWPWEADDSYQKIPLMQIRRELNLRLLE